MKVVSRNEAVILGVTLDGSDLTIRIDRNGLAQNQFEGIPVINLVFNECSNTPRTFYELSESVGKPLEYEILKQGDGTIALLWVDYSVDETEVKCAHVTETASDYTVDDWQLKCNRLAGLYLTNDEDNGLYGYMYFLLADSLQKWLDREIDVRQRKIEFLTQTNPEKAKLFRSELKAYRKLLALMGRDKELPTMLQIEGWILSEWDNDHFPLGHQETIRRRIVDMGEAAIFPLLELLGRHDDEIMRGEIVYILKCINPAIADAIRTRLDLDASA